ncbi:hypothetical protein BN1326_60168 [Staphylococcus argenteus]|uniref:Uncharacterized protein n=1 Tax=Staphylococcus argenteus TaxID=985002 RepID=A0A7U7JTS6_9STAP|nr:hypothetical protein BN1326_60168 [Staphylococcus argenteus]CRI25787.1 hypothetical protein BN1326_60168 [Staphylococcus argenteus]
MRFLNYFLFLKEKCKLKVYYKLVKYAQVYKTGTIMLLKLINVRSNK